MSIAVITGSAGLVGSESARYFSDLGMDVIGIDNNMRKVFFGEEASTEWCQQALVRELKGYRHHSLDIRDFAAIDALFGELGSAIDLVIHTAAQPSHDWAARSPLLDFSVNATGTLNVLEAARQHCPEAVFIFTSTNKIYGDLPNRLPLRELDTRWEIDDTHPYREGIPETMSIDQNLHSVFGASKVAADVMVQEYGRYYGMKTTCFRGGCLTGPAHSGTQLHGFLAYLVKCAVTGTHYTVFGYEGKQVRDNIHSSDLVAAFHEVFRDPGRGEVYNMGGGRASHCSMREAIAISQEITGHQLNYKYLPDHRVGDHIWYVSDTSKFRARYGNWRIRRGIREIISDICCTNRERWERGR